MSANSAYTPDRDREEACWVTTATGDEVHHGTIRHDDFLAGGGNGWQLFDQNTGFPVDTTVAGFEFVSCSADECCPQQIGEGCWDDGSDTGTWVSIRLADGTVEVTDPATGLPVDSADVVECTGRHNETTIRNVTSNTSYVIPAVDPLLSWSVRVITQPVSIDVNGSGAIGLAAAESMSSTVEPGGVLDDTVTITVGVGGQAHVLHSNRS